MVAKYEKIDLAGFKKKLAEGAYVSLTGARRAVGRMTTWTENEKDKARAAAEKHFAEGGAKKKVTKKAAKRSKKKTTKKPVKKTAKKKTTKRAKKSVKRVAKRQSRKKAEDKGSVMERTKVANYQIQTAGQAIDLMAKNKQLGVPSSAIAEGAKAAQDVLTNAVNNLCQLTKEATDNASGGNSDGSHAFNRAVDATTNGAQQATEPAVPPAPPPAEN
jgi:hypothetical protein